MFIHGEPFDRLWRCPAAGCRDSWALSARIRKAGLTGTHRVEAVPPQCAPSDFRATSQDCCRMTKHLASSQRWLCLQVGPQARMRVWRCTFSLRASQGLEQGKPSRLQGTAESCPGSWCQSCPCTEHLGASLHVSHVVPWLSSPPGMLPRLPSAEPQVPVSWAGGLSL